MRYFFCLLIVCVGICGRLMAHPMPNSVLQLEIKSDGVTAELQWPLKELQYVFPGRNINLSPGTLIGRMGATLDSYLLAHMSVTDSAGRDWKVAITGKKVTEAEQSMTGPFHELVFTLWLQPPPGASLRHFTIHYDAIMHQVVTHKMLISVKQDWDGGIAGKENPDADLGVLMMNITTNQVPPIIVNLDEGSRWKGFKSMVALGIRHISEGTDHLLFLLVLMLPAPLISSRGKWAGCGGARYSLFRLLKIATAFTIGHSITLLAGATGWLRLPSQPVELLMSVSILVGAVHALRPLFPGREVFIAAGFGLIHGLAFAATLASLHLDAGRMALSILGFNVGIELMQLFVLLLFVPWLIILGHYYFYRWLRIAGALFAIVAACAWITERITLHANTITNTVQSIAAHGQWIILALALLALATYLLPQSLRHK